MISKITSHLISGSKAVKLVVYLFLEILGLFVKITDYLFSKCDRIIIFGSNGGEYPSGSSKALFDYLSNISAPFLLYYYLPFKNGKGLFDRLIYIKNFIPIFFRAKFLISSHPPTDFFPFLSWSGKKVFINVWHGIPIKGIFFRDHKASKLELIRILKLNKRTSAFIVSSKLEAFLIRMCFRIDQNKIYCLGHPRNDILLKKDKSQKLSDILPNLPDYKKAILYCPTYRRGQSVRFFPFHDFNLQHFKRFLEDNQLIILLRQHPYDKQVIKSRSKRIIPFGFETCNDVNEILPEINILITDYSSVFFDYYLLDRPCIFIPYDLEEYQKDVGFLLDYNAVTAGPKVQTYKEFIDAIKNILQGQDSFGDQRRKLKTIFHECQRENSCEKIFQIIKNFNLTKND